PPRSLAHSSSLYLHTPAPSTHSTLSLHDALPIYVVRPIVPLGHPLEADHADHLKQAGHHQQQPVHQRPPSPSVTFKPTMHRSRRRSRITFSGPIRPSATASTTTVPTVPIAVKTA